MALETGTYIDSLVATNPTATDALAQADDHLRLIKATIKATFPSITGAVTLTHTQINDLQSLQGVLSAPSGTQMLFRQSAAPTGWTKNTAHNDKALRVVSGSVSTGGSVDFATAFASQTPAGSVSTSVSGTVGDTSLTEAMLPAHRHFIAANVTNNDTTFLSSTNQAKRGGHTELTSNNAEDYHLGGVSTDATVGRTSSVGSGSTHTHTFSGSGSSSFVGSAINLAVKYIDLILASKD